MRFDTYVEHCLYGPDGFYRTIGSAGGRRGDFITSPEIGPLFGAVLANAIDGWWTELGRPDPLTVYDVGSGPGTLLNAVALARPDRPWNLVSVDVASPSADLTELPADLTGAVVVANELLDNLPFRVVEGGEHGLVEWFVDLGDDGAPRLVTHPAGSDVGLAATLEPGASAPLLDRATAWVTSVIDRGAARLCTFDYGAPTTAALAERGGWLRTYRQHERGDDPLVEPGRWDITTDVAWDQLPTPDQLMTQADFLTRWGIEELVAEGKAYWRANAHAPDLTAMRMRSRVSEAEALLTLDGLGGWWVAIWAAAAPERG